MPLRFQDLQPYISLVMTSVADGTTATVAVQSVLNYFADYLGITPVCQSGPHVDAKLVFGFVHFQIRKTPPWTTDAAVVDVSNHLAFVASRGGYAAVLVTDPGSSRKFLRRLDTDPALSFLSKLDPARLNGAFVRGATRTLWLNGIHTPTSAKPDSKVFMGKDLRDALDPLTDQTYFFTSLRADSTIGTKRTVGISPQKSRVWTGASSGWADFRDNLTALFTAIAGTKRARNRLAAPLPVLAVPLAPSSVATEAYEAAIIPPEVLSDDGVDAETLALAERWAYSANFSVTAMVGPNFTAEISFGPTLLGTLKVTVDMSNPHDVQLAVDGDAEPGQEELFDEAKLVCSRVRWLKVYYNSGHTLADARVFQQRFREMPFPDWEFHAFGGYELNKEKPRRPTFDKNGKAITVDNVLDTGNQKSLFCWVLNQWPESATGWLACDDGGGEIADFVFLESTLPARLTLIHVKASSDDAKAGEQRRLSVSDFEIVSAQAIKNLRRFDREILATDLKSGAAKQVGNLVWKDRVKQGDRTGFLDALNAVGDQCRRRVIILQPRPLKSELERLRTAFVAKQVCPDIQVLLQLETLLLATQASCRGLGAEFTVIADGG